MQRFQDSVGRFTVPLQLLNQPLFGENFGIFDY